VFLAFADFAFTVYRNSVRLSTPFPLALILDTTSPWILREVHCDTLLKSGATGVSLTCRPFYPIVFCLSTYISIDSL